jgi:hypothetical protein
MIRYSFIYLLRSNRKTEEFLILEYKENNNNIGITEARIMIVDDDQGITFMFKLDLEEKMDLL